MKILLIIAGIIGFIILFAGLIKLVVKMDKKTLTPKIIPDGISETAVITDFHQARGKYSLLSGCLDYVCKMFIGLTVSDHNGNIWQTNTTEFVKESQFNLYVLGNIQHE